MPGTIEPVENGAYRIRHLKVDAEVGDPSTPGFKPKLKLKRWEGECSIEVDFADEALEEELEEELDAEGNITKVKWKVKTADAEMELEYYPTEPREEILVVDGMEHRFLQNEEGGLEFGIVLTKKPMVNTLSFPLKIEGLRFAYQPPLHPDHPTWDDRNGDGRADIFRPENVVGSYPAYHLTRGNIHASKEDAEKYKAGKAGHFYYPYLTDADGWKVRVEGFKIDTEKGLLTVTLPQEFLDAAKYPVVIDPNFGLESKGATSAYVDNIAGEFGCKFTAPSAGTLVSMSCYMADNFTETGSPPTWADLGSEVPNWEFAIYEDGVAGVQVDVTNRHIGNGAETSGWQTLTFPPVPGIIAAQPYWLYSAWEDSNRLFVYIYCDSDGDDRHAYTPGDLYDNWPADLDDDDFTVNGTNIWSIYCTYAAAPPGWTGKISGVTNPAEVMGVAAANIAEVKGVA